MSDSVTLVARSPAKTVGSVEASKTNSPGSAQTSTTLPCSTMIMHWPSATAMTLSAVMMLSLALVLLLRPETRLLPLTSRVSAGRDSQ